MNKYERAEYLANLLSILDSQDDAARTRSQAISEEYQRAYEEFKQELRDERSKD